ncbi:hypothetical protein F4778DRAFT_316816 [Xylariomycetidae sp. FL2044]|nr:hypothetical protein F4778DRAFT_316816 [Xylariomycetidae sp. FL2044]
MMNDSSHMLVGSKLVPEVDAGPILGDHIIIHDWVHDIRALRAHEPGLFHSLMAHTATDASAALAVQDPDGEARHDLIIAGITPVLPDIPAGELAYASSPVNSLATWIIVHIAEDAYHLYEVGHLMRYPNYHDRTTPSAYAGSMLNNPELVNWPETDHQARLIGRLVDGSAAQQPRGPIRLKSS